MKKFLLAMYPYVICVVAGTILFVSAARLSGDIKSVVLGISGAFFAIPCLYVIYEAAQKFSNRKLNKELLDYAKMRIDRETLSIVNQLMKAVHTYDERDFSFKGIQAFLSQSGRQIATAIEGNEYLGFQVLKDWSTSEGNIIQILESPFILQRLDNNQVISLISLMKQIRSLEGIQRNAPDLYEITDKKANGYKVQAGSKLHNSNAKYPDRYLLLRHLSDDKYQVTDFGDFPLYQVPKLLHIFRVNKTYAQAYAQEISDLITAINNWLELTGTEFLVDTKLFRIGARVEPVNSDREKLFT